MAAASYRRMFEETLRNIFFWLAFTPTAFAGQPSPARIPALHTSALNGETVDLPDSLKGRPAVLVLGFSQDSRGDVTAWGKRLADDFQDSSAVRFYEMAVLSGVPKFLRGYVVRKISADLPALAKPHFLPIYEGEPEWRSVAGYSKAEDAYVLVVDGGGVVRWRVEGPATEASYREMKRHLEAIRAE